jgi:daunorubicin resistance ABC transporter ATP-binding subunit
MSELSPATLRPTPARAGTPAILATGLVKRFGPTEALRGIDLIAEQGSVLGLLGPNGAGKTTSVRILTTLIRPDAGSAQVLGYDVVRQPREVRARIGLTGQFAAVDETLTGFENLVLVGRLAGLRGPAARRRATEMLERLELVEAAGRAAKTYSGGMRRRLDIAASLMTAPPLLVLDEPTTGLDARARLSIWEMVDELVRDGAAVLLTSQYLEEVDRLASQVVVIDGGRTIADGTPDELKDRVGGSRLVVTLAPGPGQPGRIEQAAAIVGRVVGSEARIQAERNEVSAPVATRAGLLPRVIRELDESGIDVEDLAVRQATLNDVFLALTGHATATGPAAEPGPEQPARRGRGPRGAGRPGAGQPAAGRTGTGRPGPRGRTGRGAR